MPMQSTGTLNHDHLYAVTAYQLSVNWKIG